MSAFIVFWSNSDMDMVEKRRKRVACRGRSQIKENRVYRISCKSKSVQLLRQPPWRASKLTMPTLRTKEPSYQAKLYPLTNTTYRSNGIFLKAGRVPTSQKLYIHLYVEQVVSHMYTSSEPRLPYTTRLSMFLNVLLLLMMPCSWK